QKQGGCPLQSAKILQSFDPPLPPPRVLPARRTQVRRTRETPSTERPPLLRALAELGSQGLALDASSPGSGCNPLGKTLHRLVDQHPLPRLLLAGGLENPPRQRPTCLDARVDHFALRLPPTPPRHVDRAGADRSRALL